MSEWRKICANGNPSDGRSPESGHRMAAEGMQFRWRWNGGTIFPNLNFIWGMSVKRISHLPGLSPVFGNAVDACFGGGLLTSHVALSTVIKVGLP